MKKHFLKYSFFAFIFLLGFVAQAQHVPVDNELEKKYTPNSNSIFNDLQRKQSEISGGSSSSFKNAIKFTPTALLRQKVLFWYERELFSKFTVNLGVGKPFGKDIMQQVWFALFNEFTPRTDYVAVGKMQENGNFSGSGLTLAIAPRIYFDGAFEDSFFELVYMHERVDLMLQENQPPLNAPIKGNKNVSFEMNSLSLNWGITWRAGRKEKLVNDFIIGLGAKYFTYDAFYAYPSYYQKSGHRLNTILFACASFGYSLGFGF